MLQKTKLFIALGIAACLFSACKEDNTLAVSDARLNLDTTPIAAVKNGMLTEVDIDAVGPWQTSSNKDWIKVSPSWGINDGAISITITKNRTDETRNGLITVSIGEEIVKTIAVNQQAGVLVPVGERNFYVTTTGQIANDGTDWELPTTLDAALDEAVSGEVIHIAAGTYTPGIHLTGASGATGGAVNGDKTFEIKQNITLIGGYPAGAQEGAVADPAANPTILSGELSTGNAYHVVSVTALKEEGKKVHLKGLTITKGVAHTANDAWSVNGVSYRRSYGAGFYIAQARVELEDCIVSENRLPASTPGGGIFCRNSTELTLRNCRIEKNSGALEGSSGVGIALEASTLTAYNTTFFKNEAGGNGATILASTGPVTAYLYNCTFNENKTGMTGWGSRPGSAWYGWANTVCTMVNCTLFGNLGTPTASSGGGGSGGAIALHDGGKANLVSCTVTGNLATHTNGGGGYFYNSGNPRQLNLYNTVFSGNVSRFNEANQDVSSPPSVKKNSIVGSTVYDSGEGALAGATFVPGTMLGTLGDNGGRTQTIPLIGMSNPATTGGMSAAELSALATTLSINAEGATYLPVDQRGQTRTDRKMGACNQ
ncbi:MAG: right-handed parallel beta-helix repeat-containing protein [Rikenellaceae bacterium]|jgi:hypothetical protein|nr:right-handed parallel beta-helix repeat-containing protein [Rikenellaceae bacterium]